MIITMYRTGEDGRLRYYTLHDRQPVMGHPYALTVAWRTGNGAEREKLYVFDSLAEMDRKIRQVFGRRIRDGYRLLYSFSRESPARRNAREAVPPPAVALAT